MKIGIRSIGKRKVVCFTCKSIVLNKYYFQRVGNKTLKYCEKCGKMKLLNGGYYNKEIGKLYGIERKI